MPWSEDMFNDSDSLLDITYEQVDSFIQAIAQFATKFTYGKSRMTKGRLTWKQRSRVTPDYKSKADRRELNLNHQHATLETARTTHQSSTHARYTDEWYDSKDAWDKAYDALYSRAIPRLI
jgi:hypothetical protein